MYRIKSTGHSEEELLYFAFIKHGVPIFEMDFHAEGSKVDSALLTGFVSAVSSFSKELSSHGLESIDQGKLKVGYIEGELVSLTYMANSISENLQTKLELIVKNFERIYKPLLTDDYITNPSLFTDYVPIVIKALSASPVKGHFIPSMLVSIYDSLAKYPEFQDILNRIDGSMTISEITLKLGEKLTPSVIEKYSLMRLNGLIEFDIQVETHDVFELNPFGIRQIFSIEEEKLVYTYGEKVLDFIKSINGVYTVTDLIQKNEISSTDAQNVLSLLLSKELISHVPERIKTILALDCIFNSLYHNLSKHLEKTSARDVILISLKESDSLLVKLVKFENDHFDFKLIYSYLKSTEMESHDIYDVFMDPLLEIFDEASEIESEVDISFLVFEEANQKFGVIF